MKPSKLSSILKAATITQKGDKSGRIWKEPFGSWVCPDDFDHNTNLHYFDFLFVVLMPLLLMRISTRLVSEIKLVRVQSTALLGRGVVVLATLIRLRSRVRIPPQLQNLRECEWMDQ